MRRIDSGGCVRRAKSERLELLSSYKSGKESLVEFCSKHGLAPSTLRTWLKREQNKSQSEMKAEGIRGFVSLAAPETKSPKATPIVQLEEMRMELELGSVFRFLYFWSKR